MPQIEFTKRLQSSPNDHIESMKKIDIKDNSKATLKKNKSVTGLPSASVVDNRSTSKNTKSRNSNHVGNIKTSETRVKPKKLSGIIT
jgi:phage gp45-like